jgi:DNA-binding response OmpR family regulator
MNRQILLIEDELTLSLLLRERLEKEGYSVTNCKDGEHGRALPPRASRLVCSVSAGK